MTDTYLSLRIHQSKNTEPPLLDKLWGHGSKFLIRHCSLGSPRESSTKGGESARGKHSKFQAELTLSYDVHLSNLFCNNAQLPVFLSQ